MSKVFNIYENIDMIDPAELKRAAGLKDPEKVTWPKGKKYKVQLGGKECSVTTYFSNAEGSAYGQFDAFTALSTMMTRDEVVEKMWELDPNGGSDAVNYAQAEFLPGLPELSDEEKEHRKAFTAAVLTLLSDQKTIEMLADCAPRKKNGLFHKGRVFKIGLTGFADKYSNELIEIVGRSKDETKLSVTVTGRSTSPEELEMWNQDFISTYHEGLPISEAFKTVFENIASEAPQDEIKHAIKPDLYGGLGDGSQEIDTSEIDKDKDFLKGVRPKYQEKAQKGMEKLSPYLVDPNKIDWEGKYVYIDRMTDITVLNKIREMGAYTLRSNTVTMDYMVEAVDFKSFKNHYSALDEEYYSSSYIGELINIIKQSNASGIIEERDFLRWCVNGHEIKYDLSKDEHLKKYENEKMSFKKIDKKMFIKQAIKKTDPYKYKEMKDWNNGEIIYCVVGSSEKAEKVRSFFKEIGKAVMDRYIEGARWPRLILGDPNGEDEKRAYKIALYNKDAGEKLQVWSAEQVLELVNLYGEGIKANAEQTYTSATLDKLVEQIIENAQTGGAVDIKKAQNDARLDEELSAETVMKAMKAVDSIDFAEKTFVFVGAGKVDGVYYCDYDLNDPAIREVLGRGGKVNLKKVTGKTDYLVINTKDQFAWKGARIRDAAIQLGKRDTIKIISLNNLLEILEQDI